MDFQINKSFLFLSTLLVSAIVLLFFPFSSSCIDRNRNENKMLKAHPVRFWELNPGYKDKNIRINSLGCRGAEPDNRKLMWLLGDEHIFSASKFENETFALFLENRLQKAGFDIQVLNGGVPYYSIAQMLSWAAEGSIKPDYVCISYSVHDQDPADTTDLEYMGNYLVQDIKRLLWGGYISRSFIADRIEYNYSAFCKLRNRKGGSKRVTDAEMHRCMKQLADLFRSKRCKSIIFLHLPSAVPRFEKIHAQDYEFIKGHRKNEELDRSLDEAELKFVDYADGLGYLCDLHEMWHNDGRINDSSLAGDRELTVQGCKAAADDFVKEIVRRKLIQPIQK